MNSHRDLAGLFWTRVTPWRGHGAASPLCVFSAFSLVLYKRLIPSVLIPAPEISQTRVKVRLKPLFPRCPFPGQTQAGSHRMLLRVAGAGGIPAALRDVLLSPSAFLGVVSEREILFV